MRIRSKNFEVIFWALLLLPTVTEAHPFNMATESESLIDGFLHPLTSSDHILTMLAVGLWISQAGLRWILILPMVFVSILLIGGVMPVMGFAIPYAKYFMYVSVLALGVLLIGTYKIPQFAEGLVVAAVAFFHGYVHVYDMMLDVEGIGYMAGFTIATLLLMIIGVLSRIALNFILSKTNAGFWGSES